MKKMVRLLGMLIVCFVLVLTYDGAGSKVQASGNVGAFDGLSGDAKYLGSNYRDNYYLDIQKCELMDAPSKLINDIANVLFSFITGIALIVCNVFYECMEFNIASLFADQINAMQSALKESVFNPLLILALCGTSWILVTHLIKRNLVASLSEMGKVILVIALSFLIVENASTVLTACTTITKSFSIAAMTGMNGDGGGGSLENYAAESAGVLWVNLVHEPWKNLEFGSDPQHIASDPANIAKMEEFLSNNYQPGSARRVLELVEKYAPAKEKEVQYFQKGTIGGKRVGELLTYLIPFIIKCAIYIVMSIIQICFQILGLLYFVMAPLVLLLALLPDYGMNIINAWLKKILETQISIFIVTLALGLLIKCDSMLFALSADWGYMIVMVFQIAAAAGLFFGREKILNVFGKVQKGMQNPAYMMALMRNSGNVKQLADSGSRAVKKGGKAAFAAATTAVAAGHVIKKGIYDPITSVGTDSADGGLSSRERKRPNLSESIEKSVRQQAAIKANQKENPERKLQKRFVDAVGQKVYKTESFINKMPGSNTARPETRTSQDTASNSSRAGKTTNTASAHASEAPDEPNRMRTVKENRNNFKKDKAKDNNIVNYSTKAGAVQNFDVSDSLQMKKEDDARIGSPMPRPVTDTSSIPNADMKQEKNINDTDSQIQPITPNEAKEKYQEKPTQENPKEKVKRKESKKEAAVEKNVGSKQRAASPGGSTYSPEINVNIPARDKAKQKARPTTDTGMSDETKRMLKQEKAE